MTSAHTPGLGEKSASNLSDPPWPCLAELSELPPALHPAPLASTQHTGPVTQLNSLKSCKPCPGLPAPGSSWPLPSASPPHAWIYLLQILLDSSQMSPLDSQALPPGSNNSSLLPFFQPQVHTGGHCLSSPLSPPAARQQRARKVITKFEG